MGKWENFEDMEAKLTIDELYTLHSAVHRAEHRRNKFAAALKGINLDEGETTKFDEIEAQARAELSGMSEQEFNFDMMGITIDDEEEVYD